MDIKDNEHVLDTNHYRRVVEEYEKNGQTLIPEVAIVSEVVSDSTSVYKDFLQEAPFLDSTKEFAEYIVLPAERIAQASAP